MREASLVTSLIFFGSTAHAQDAEVPHLAQDIAAGDVEHAASHFVDEAKISTYKFGKPVETSISDLVDQFRECRFVQFGRSDFFVNGNFDVLTFDCGQPYNYALHTGGLTDKIVAAEYYAEATLPPPAPPLPSISDVGEEK